MDEQQQKGAAAGFDALRQFAGRVQAFDLDSATARVDAAAAEALAAFEASGEDALLLKGRALAALLYTAGEHRSYSDTDLLVAPSRLDAAEKALTALGYSNAHNLTGVEDVGGVVHAHTWIRTTGAEHSMIDLHRWLPGARESPEVAWERLVARRTWIDVAGRRVAVLDRSGQAMHLALHAAQHGAEHTRQLDELALALRRWPPDVWNRAAELAQEVGATEALAAGLRLLPQGTAEASRLGLPSSAELDWTIRHRAARPRGTFHLQALAEANGVAERLRILRRAFLPGQAWIMYQHPWAREGRLRLMAAYALHLARAPAWAARAGLFAYRARRARRR